MKDNKAIFEQPLPRMIIEQRASVVAQNYFRKIETKRYDELRGFHENEELQNELARAAREEEMWEKRQYGVGLQHAAYIFCVELAKYAHKAVRENGHIRMQPHGSKRMDNPIVKLENALLSVSPNILDLLSLEDRFKVALLFNRTPQLDRHFQDESLATLTQVLTFGNGRFLNKELDRVMKAAVDEQLAFLEVLHRLVTLSFAQGYDHERRLLTTCDAAIRRFINNSPYPLVRYSAIETQQSVYIYAIDDIGAEQSIDGLRVISRKRAHLQQRRDETDQLTRGHLFKHMLERGEYVRRISSDYIGLFTSAGRLELVATPKGNAYEYVDDLLKNPTVLPVDMDYVADSLFRLQELHKPMVRDRIEQMLGIKYSEVPLRDQMQLLEFVSQQHDDVFEKMQKLLHNQDFPYKDFLKAFFACAADARLGDELVAAAEIIDPKTFTAILVHYNEITAALYKIEKSAQDFFVDKSASVIDTRKVVREFVVRSAQGLRGALKNPEQGLQELTRMRGDVLIFTSLFKSTFGNRSQLTLADVTGLDLHLRQQQDLSQEDKDQMIGIAAGNWLSRGEVGACVVAGLRKKLEEFGVTQWYVLKKYGVILAFVRFEIQPDYSDGRTHEFAGSFNVHPQYRGSAIGEAMIHEALNKEAGRAILHATMDPRIDVGIKYIEDTGFFVTGIADNYLGTDESFFEIVCDRKEHNKFVTRRWTKEKIIKFGRKHINLPVAEQIARGAIIVLNVTRNAGVEPSFVAGAREALNAGFVGTRYIAEPQQKSVRYMVFEKQS